VGYGKIDIKETFSTNKKMDIHKEKTDIQKVKVNIQILM